LARDRFLGKVPENYIPSMGLHIYPGQPRCSVIGCDEYAVHRSVDHLTGEHRYARFCGFHIRRLNRDRTLPKTYRPADFTLPLPSLVVSEAIEVHCSVAGCERKVGARRTKLGSWQIRSLCRHHSSLRRRGLPDDYKYQAPPIERRIRGRCAADGCRRLQANKGFSGGELRYDKYCERHRRGPYKAKRIERAIVDTSLCSRCGWIGPCDKHRLIAGKDGGNYRAKNVIVVCPNCHRLLHRGIISISTS
jgi:hypothetical protein